MSQHYFSIGKRDRLPRSSFVRWRHFWWRSFVFLFALVLTLTPCLQMSAKEEPKPIPQEWQIKGIEAALEDNRTGVKARAVEQLVNYGPQYVKALATPDPAGKIASVLKDKQQNSYMRGQAVEALSNLNESAKQYIPDVLNFIKDKQQDDNARRKAAEALSNLDESAKQYIPDILNFIEDKQQDSYMRGKAAEALSNLGESEKLCIPAIATILKDKQQDSEMRSWAALALSNFGGSASQYIPDILDFINDKQQYSLARSNATYALGNFGESAKQYISVIADILKDKQQDSHVRGNAAEALGNLGEPAKQYIPDILDFIEDKQQDYQPRSGAVHALGNFSESVNQYVPRIAAILNDKEQPIDIRNSVAEVLGDFGESAKKYIPDILNFTKEKRQDEAHASVHYVLTVRDTPITQQHIPGIAAILNDKKQPIGMRGSAARALSDSGESAKKYIPDLAIILADKQQDSNLRSSAAYALGNFGELAKQYIPDILDFIKDKQQGEARLWVAHTLDKSGKLNLDQVLILLNPAYEEKAEIDAWRFYAHFLSGGDEDVKRLLKWIAEPKLPLPQLNHDDHDEGAKTLEAFRKAWELSKDFPEIRDDLANKTAIVSKMVTWQMQDLPLLKQHYGNLKTSHPANADSLRATINSLETWQWVSNCRTVILTHTVFWLALIFAYPQSPQIQAIFFWNPWVRNILGFGYITFLLAWVPFLRRKLFQPFQPSLLADAGLDQFNPEGYFPDSEVSLKTSDISQPITTAFPSIKGQVILEGESGLGKTMFLRHLLKQSQRIAVYLPATK